MFKNGRLLVRMNPILNSVKKSSPTPPDKYDPKYVEEGWYEWWETNGFFSVNNGKSKALPLDKRYTMLLPPPNVTGSLHIGHALTIAIQDCLARWRRMCGYQVLWIPGTDHAGIATQSVVERRLFNERGLNKNEIGREELLKLIWAWKDTYANTICNQIRRMGASLDWSKETFTLDSIRSTAVTEAFIRFHNAGILYRDARLVCLSPALATVISDIEVNTMEVDKPQKINIPGLDTPVEFGYLWIFKYNIQDSNEFISVATSRIETMLGDVGVAVHPEDSRYKHLLGKKLLHPFIPDREMLIIADETVDKDYGTGAVKLTPAHDKHDFDICKRHNLPLICIFDMNGRINSVSSEFKGLHRFKCREIIEQRLSELGLLLDKIPNTKPMQIPTCSRSGDVVEYTILPQWWVNCKELAKRAIESVERGDLEIVPNSYVSVWTRWLENIQDWCISRQLWWGHRIPAYQIVIENEPSGEWIIASSQEEAYKELEKMKLPNKNKVVLLQDDDVLDTWFSSGLSPLSSFGWPNETEDLQLYFPTTLLETGNDILFFWVARMVMMSLQLVGRLPFKTIYLHPLVRDAKGEKMSKSKGNVIDPLEVSDGISLEGILEKFNKSNLPKGEVKKAIEEAKKNFPEGIPPCGSDSLRLGLLELTRQNRAICLNIAKIVSCRHFCNKLWNATKVLNNYKGQFPIHYEFSFRLQFEDEWILHRLYKFSETANESLAKFNFSDMVQSIYQFWLYDFCDVYLELVKSRLVNECRVAAWVTLFCMDNGLRLIHPVMPYVSEQLYQQLPLSYRDKSIMLSTYPKPARDWTSNTLPSMEAVKEITHALRSMATLLGFDHTTKKICFVDFINNANDRVINQYFMTPALNCIKTLSKFESVTLFDSDCVGECIVNNVTSRINVYIRISHLGVDMVTKIKEKLIGRRGKVENMLLGYEKKVKANNYDKVPENIRILNDEKIKELSSSLSELENAIRQLEIVKSS